MVHDWGPRCAVGAGIVGWPVSRSWRKRRWRTLSSFRTLVESLAIRATHTFLKPLTIKRIATRTNRCEIDSRGSWELYPVSVFWPSR